jgi:hypothetical protein
MEKVQFTLTIHDKGSITSEVVFILLRKGIDEGLYVFTQSGPLTLVIMHTLFCFDINFFT